MHINCDMGESYGSFKVGNDEALMPLVDACNIACGFHGGDPLSISRTIDLAIRHQVEIGAHPSYPDLLGFGRRVIPMSTEELQAALAYQICAIKGMVEAQDYQISYVKPHGALYHQLALNIELAHTLVQTVKSIDPTLAILGLPGNHTTQLCLEADVTFIPEAFGDRIYQCDGMLSNRETERAVIESIDEAVDQINRLSSGLPVTTLNGSLIHIQCQSICIHGDNPNAVAILQKLRGKP